MRSRMTAGSPLIAVVPGPGRETLPRAPIATALGVADMPFRTTPRSAFTLERGRTSSVLVRAITGALVLVVAAAVVFLESQSEEAAALAGSLGISAGESRGVELPDGEAVLIVREGDNVCLRLRDGGSACAPRAAAAAGELFLIELDDEGLNPERAEPGVPATGASAVTLYGYQPKPAARVAILGPGHSVLAEGPVTEGVYKVEPRVNATTRRITAFRFEPAEVGEAAPPRSSSTAELTRRSPPPPRSRPASADRAAPPRRPSWRPARQLRTPRRGPRRSRPCRRRG